MSYKSASLSLQYILSYSSLIVESFSCSSSVTCISGVNYFKKSSTSSKTISSRRQSILSYPFWGTNPYSSWFSEISFHSSWGINSLPETDCLWENLSFSKYIIDLCSFSLAKATSPSIHAIAWTYLLKIILLSQKTWRILINYFPHSF